VLTFRDGVATTSFAAGEIAKYYVAMQEPSVADLVAGYYGKAVQGMARDGAYAPLAERLGVDTARPITQGELANVVRGLRTDGDRIEGKQYQRASDLKGKITYYDFTLNAPKSVSIAWAFAPTERERGIFLEAHRYAVDRSMAYLEQTTGWARRGRGGSKGAEQGHMMWWKFEEYTARPVAKIADRDNTILKAVGQIGDMHLHTHCITPNVVMTESGHVGAIDSKRLNGQIKEIGKVYQGFLARRLREHGVDAGLEDRTRMAALRDIPRWAVELFSKRTADGNEAARQYAREQGLDWDALSVEERVRLVDRSVAAAREKHPEDKQPQFDAWNRQAEAAGYRHRSVLRPGRERFLARQRERLRAAFERSLPQLAAELDRRAVFGGEVARIAAAEGLIEAGISDDPGRDIAALTRAYRTEGVAQDGEWTALLWGKVPAPPGEGRDGESLWQRFTTEKHLRMEQETVALLKKGATDRRHALTPREIDEAIEKVARESGIRLTAEQAGLAHALGEAGGVVVGRGAAGVGKTTVLTPLVEAWHARGLDTVYLTVPWRQAHAGKDSGVKRSQAIAAFTYGVARGRIAVGENTVVIADELSQVGTAMMNDLAKLRDAHGFKLVGIGHELQGNPIQAGNSLRLAEVVLGKLPTLLQTVRQRREEAALVAKFHSGDEATIAEALRHKAADGTLLLVPGDHRDAIRRAVELWDDRTRANAAEPGYRFGISVPTNADVLAIGAAIRERRQARGEVGGDAKVLDAVDQHGTEYRLPIAVGDRVRLFNRAYGRFGRGNIGRIGDNGSVVEVVAIRDDGLTVRTAKGRIATVPWDQFRFPETEDRIRLTYGDAMTIDSRQGDTVTEALALYPHGSRTVNGLKGYVAASRHRRRFWIITSQGAELEEIKERRPIGDPRNQITRRAAVQEFIVANMARNLARQELKQLSTDFVRLAEVVKRGTVAAKRAVWDRAPRAPGAPQRSPGPAAPSHTPAASEAPRDGPEAPRIDPRVAVWTRQIAEGAGYEGMFADVVQLEFRSRLEAERAAGRTADHDALWERAMDAVVAAIERHDHAAAERPMTRESALQLDPQAAAWARQIAEGKGYDGMLADVIELEFRSRIERADAEGRTVDHEVVRRQATAAVTAAIERDREPQRTPRAAAPSRRQRRADRSRGIGR
jgi:conjugative relaxase-like TrwC/TraI family protein